MREEKGHSFTEKALHKTQTVQDHFDEIIEAVGQSEIQSEVNGLYPRIPGRKLLHKESNTVYIIRAVKQENVILVSEDGGTSMLLHQDSIVFSGFEPVHD